MSTSLVTLSGAEFGGLTVQWPNGEPTQSVEWEGAVHTFRRVQEVDRFGGLVDTNVAVFTGLSRP